jgi:hypothetical protein
MAPMVTAYPASPMPDRRLSKLRLSAGEFLGDGQPLFFQPGFLVLDRVQFGAKLGNGIPEDGLGDFPELPLP